MMTGSQYIESLRELKTEVYFMGERVDSVVDHPAIRPHINAAAATYDLAHDAAQGDLARATSHITGRPVNRWTHVPRSQDDLVKKAKMMRAAGRITGTCFQRCVGMDALITLYSVTHDIDRKHGTSYHERFRAFLIDTQDRDLMTGGAMTDPKGDRSKRPHEQHDPDLFVRVVERREDGIVVRGAKMHQTGAVNSHQFLVLPGQALGRRGRGLRRGLRRPGGRAGVIQVFGRQVNDSRKWEGKIDQGNATYGVVGGEALVIFDDVFVPKERVFMLGEAEFAGTLVERFTSYHRQNYGGCKSGNLDVLDRRHRRARRHPGHRQGRPRARQARRDGSPRRDDVLGRASRAATSARRWTAARRWSNRCSRTAPSSTPPATTPRSRGSPRTSGAASWPPWSRSVSWTNPRVAGFVRKFYQTRPDVPAEDRLRLGRLIENMTGATPIVECMHGAGSPQAQKVVLQRTVDWPARRRLAARIAGTTKA